MTWDPRVALEEDRQRTRDRVADIAGDYAGIVEASLDSNADDEHDPEGATIAFERSQVGALLDQARAHLVEIDAALGLLGAGTYGSSEECGGTIAQGRLEARPTARACIDCAGRRR